MLSIRRNSFYGILSFGLPTVVMLISYPLLIDRLGQMAFGVFVLANSISGILAFLDLGFSSATVKLVSEALAKDEMARIADVITTSLYYYCGLGLLGAILIWNGAPWLVAKFSVPAELEATAVWTFRIAAAQFVVSFPTLVYISLFKGLQRFDLPALAMSSLSVLTYGGAIASILLTGTGLIGVSLVSLGANIFVLLLVVVSAFYLCRAKKVNLLGGSLNSAIFKSMFGYGSILALNSLGVMLLMRSQVFMIGYFLGPAAVTVYQIAFSIASKSHALLNAASEVLFPAISFSLAKASGTFNMRSIYLRQLLGATFVGIAALMVIVIFGRHILTLMYGLELSNKATLVLYLLAGGFVLLTISAPSAYILNGAGYHKVNLSFSLINGVLSALVSLMLMHFVRYDVMAFALGFLIANVITFVFYQLYVEGKAWRRMINDTRAVA